MPDKKKEPGRTTRLLELFTAEFIILFVLLFVCIIVFAYSVRIVFIRRTSLFDEQVFEYVSYYVHPFRTSFMVFISFLGKHTFLIPANLVLLGFYIFIRKNKRLTVRITALALSSLSLMFVLKLFFQRSRPDIPLLEEVSGFSFPSGHALMSMTFYGLLIYIMIKKFIR